MINNPEFRRNFWLEITPTRLAGMPLILLAAFFLAWLYDGHIFGSSVKGVAVLLFVAITFLWGTRQASESIVSEIRERTWDWQRMSALDPWTLTWGKLLGSTIYTWYGGGICLVFIAISNTNSSFAEALKYILALLLGALLMQSFGFFGSLLMLARERLSMKSNSSVMLLLAFFMATPMFSLFSSKGNISWYGIECSLIDFLIYSLAVFIFWILAGSYSLVKTEFRMNRLPCIWCGFILFIMCYLSGFAGALDVGESLASRLLLAYITAMAFTYLSAFIEKKDPVAIGRLLQNLRSGAWRKLLEGLPAWALSVPFVLVLLVLQLLMPVQQINGLASRALIVSAALFMCRDLGLLLFLNFSKKPQRADIFMLLCLMMLYGLIPGILSVTGAPQLVSIFWPKPDYWGFSLVASMIEAAIIWNLVRSRWGALKILESEKSPASAGQK